LQKVCWYALKACATVRVPPLVPLATPLVPTLDKAFYGDYFCLVALNKQQINWKEVKELKGMLGNQ